MRKTAAIIIDDWKLSIFKKTLDSEGYEYEQLNGPLAGQITFKVEYNNLERLKPIVAKMNFDAAKSKMN